MRVVIDHVARRAYVAEERRAVRRNRVYKGAVITFNKGHSVFQCLVRNQSQSGARLTMEQTFALPLSFNLAIAIDQRARHARVVWRSPTEVGVRFDEQPG
jgi:hypothetical protein